MRHRKRIRKLGRTTSHRKALFRNQATALFEHEQIRTTLPKCKELRRVAEKLITLAKKGDRAIQDGSKHRALHMRRQAAKMLSMIPLIGNMWELVAESGFSLMLGIT